jgi:lipopolysaccharide/colanic/teichoic acid biosynthesis glycosyltransferase
MKRVIDLTLAIVLIVLLLPLILAAAVCIYIIEPGPVFFVQQREGLHGRPFRMWKLRTMYRNSQVILERHFQSHPEARAEWDRYLRLANDPRLLHAIGRALRRSSIDEIPQLWNVLKGDMSLVGPRPLPVEFCEALDSVLRARRLTVLPGMTGLWQVSGRSETDITTLLHLDDQYVRTRSLRLDAWILWRTVPAVLRREGAY